MSVSYRFVWLVGSCRLLPTTFLSTFRMSGMSGLLDSYRHRWFHSLVWVVACRVSQTLRQRSCPLLPLVVPCIPVGSSFLSDRVPSHLGFVACRVLRPLSTPFLATCLNLFLGLGFVGSSNPSGIVLRHSCALGPCVPFEFLPSVVGGCWAFLLLRATLGISVLGAF